MILEVNCLTFTGISPTFILRLCFILVLTYLAIWHLFADFCTSWKYKLSFQFLNRYLGKISTKQSMSLNMKMKLIWLCSPLALICFLLTLLPLFLKTEVLLLTNRKTRWVFFSSMELCYFWSYKLYSLAIILFFYF